MGIIHETIDGYTPQSNGVAERKNRTLQEIVNFMLSYASLRDEFWGEAMLTACLILNRVPTRTYKETLYELWHKGKPNLSYLRVCGCMAILRVPSNKRKKIGERGIGCNVYRLLYSSQNLLVLCNRTG